MGRQAKPRKRVPEWALRFLRRQGYAPDTCMAKRQADWWSWYDCSSDFYAQVDDSLRPWCERHLTLRPARMVCEEFERLILDGETQVSSPDAAMGAWLDERAPAVLASLSGFVGRYMAQGSGALAVELSGLLDGAAASPGARARLRSYDAFETVPLGAGGRECAACAFVAPASAAGRVYDQVQVHAPDPASGEYVVRTWLFEPGRRCDPVAVEGVAPEVRTGSALPTFAIATPAVANTYERYTPLGVSAFDDALDAVRAVDEAFDQFYWAMRLCRVRVFVDEQGVLRDEESGEPLFSDSVDAMMFTTLFGSVNDGVPLTVYNPDMRAEQLERVLNLSLSVLSAKCGFGRGYFAFDRASGGAGPKTATEVVADNSQLLRTVQKHEEALGACLSRALRGMWAAEQGARSGSPVPEAPEVSVEWDDSVVEDTASERATMKDDIARGLCPPWLYPMRYYGLAEAEARELTAPLYAAPSEGL